MSKRLIWTEDAIEALSESLKGVFVAYEDIAKKTIDKVPSAQPVITCDGCKFVGTYDIDFPCRNCIRREKDYYVQE